MSGGEYHVSFPKRYEREEAVSGVEYHVSFPKRNTEQHTSHRSGGGSQETVLQSLRDSLILTKEKVLINVCTTSSDLIWIKLFGKEPNLDVIHETKELPYSMRKTKLKCCDATTPFQVLVHKL